MTEGNLPVPEGYPVPTEEIQNQAMRFVEALSDQERDKLRGLVTDLFTAPPEEQAQRAATLLEKINAATEHVTVTDEHKQWMVDGLRRVANLRAAQVREQAERATLAWVVTATTALYQPTIPVSVSNDKLVMPRSDGSTATITAPDITAEDVQQALRELPAGWSEMGPERQRAREWTREHTVSITPEQWQDAFGRASAAARAAQTFTSPIAGLLAVMRAAWKQSNLLPGDNALDLVRPTADVPPWVLKALGLIDQPPHRQTHSPRPPFTPSRVTILSDPETRLFMQACFELGSGNMDRLKRPDRAVPYYQSGNGKLYAAGAPITEPIDLDPVQQEAYTRKLLSLNDDKVIAHATAIAIWFADRGGERDSRGDPIIVRTEVHVNQILDFIGAKRDKGDYRPEQKRNIARDLWALSDIIIQVPQTTWVRGKERTDMIHSRLLDISHKNPVDLFGEEVPDYTFWIAPGEYAKPRMREDGAMLAQLLRPVVEVGNRRAGGKALALRIGFYLTWQWRIRAVHDNYAQPWGVATLLQGACIPLDVDHRLRSRFVTQFQETMDDLCARGVIKGWHYLDWDIEKRPFRDWWPIWLKGRVLILPPDVIVKHYADIPHAAKRAVAAAKAAATRKRAKETGSAADATTD